MNVSNRAPSNGSPRMHQHTTRPFAPVCVRRTGRATWQRWAGCLALILVLLAPAGPRRDAWAATEQPLTQEQIDRLAASSMKVPRVEFQGAEIERVCRVVADTTGMSVFVSPEVSKRVSVWARDISPIALLDRAVAAAGATYVITPSAIEVMSWEQYKERFGLAKKVVPLKFSDATQLAGVLEGFLTERGKVLAEPQANRLVLLETRAALPEILNIIKAVDVEIDGPVLEVLPLQHAGATVLAEKLSAVVGSAARPAEQRSGREAVRGGSEAEIVVYPEERTNSLIVRGSQDDVQAVMELLEALDVEIATQVRAYPLVHVDATEIYESLLEFFGLTDPVVRQQRELKLSLCSQTNSIVVAGTRAQHQRVGEFLRQVDVPLPEVPSGIHVYRLENTNAQSVAQVISDLLPPEEYEGRSAEQPTEGEESAEYAEEPGETESAGPPANRTERAQNTERSGNALEEPPRVTVNTETNAVVVRASARQHDQIRRLVEDLDRPRPQVIIEAIIVQINATDDFSLGIELQSANLDEGVDTGHLLFSAFGLSTVDPDTGERTLKPGTGLNAVVVRPDYVPIILQALDEVTDSHVTSAPRLLVNDNATGIIESVHEEPYTSINAGETVSTTTLGGYARAGTSFQVIPHISQGEAIRVEYQLELNTFTGEAAEGIPPPRTTDSIASEAVVPDGYTIIVGGLKGTNRNRTLSGIPFLSRIPLLGYLFQNRSVNESNLLTFVFLRPTILRGGRFEALKYISRQDLEAADLEDDYPRSKVKPMSPDPSSETGSR